MKRIMAISISLILIYCQHNELLTITTDKVHGYTNLVIENPQLKTPVHFTSDSLSNSGAIFFMTTEGKTWLKGKPASVSSNGNEFCGTWKNAGRTITLTFKKKEESYAFSFTASPDSDIIRWGMNLAAEHNEYFTGLLERTVDGDQQESWKEGVTTAMNLRGQKVAMLIKPTVALYCPFYLSSNGYGLFIEGSWPGYYDLCSTVSNRISVEFEGPSLSGIIYISENPATIVKNHSLHVGPTVVPPKWAFMPWRWRDNHTHLKKFYDGTAVKAPYNSMVVEDIVMMEAFDIPCAVYWIDRPWAKTKHMTNFWLQGYADFEWDEARLPHPVEMIRWLENKNIKLLLWVAPWITGDWVKEAVEKGYTIPKKTVDEEGLELIDFTNKEAVAWWQENGPAKVLKDGVKGFKLDRAEERVLDSGNVTYYNGKTARENRNSYPVDYVKAAYDICKKIHGDDFVLIPRAGYSGSARYSGFWGGDIASPPEGLRAAIIALLRSSVIGFPIWGSDIGGYWQGDLDREVCARWLAFGCFNPIMEFGPTEDGAPWAMKKEPHYDTELIAVWRLYAKLHALLADYSYNLAVEANKTGLPPVRPLFLVYPQQEQAWQDWQTFLYGQDILVSALWQKGQTAHRCYLPKGERWRDAWNPDKIYEGGTTIEVTTPFHKIPIFIRDGSNLDLGDLNALYAQSLELAKIKPDLRKLQQAVR